MARPRRRRKHKQTRAQRAASLRNIKKARAALRRRGRTGAHRRGRAHSRRRGKVVGVIVQNPEGRWTFAEASRAGHTLVGYRDHPSRGLPSTKKKRSKKKGRKKGRR